MASNLISLAHNSIIMQQLTFFELRLYGFVHVPLKQEMVNAVWDPLDKIPMKDSEAHSSYSTRDPARRLWKRYNSCIALCSDCTLRSASEEPAWSVSSPRVPPLGLPASLRLSYGRCHPACAGLLEPRLLRGPQQDQPTQYDHTTRLESQCWVLPVRDA